MKTELTHRFTSRLKIAMSFAGLMFTSSLVFAQTPNKSIIDGIMNEEATNSQLQPLAHELFDGVGPRLVGTPQMVKAADWAIDKYKSWDITARKENWGVWRGWERGLSHIDMISPRV